MTRYGFLATWIAGAAFAGNLTDRAQLTLDRVLKGGPPQYTEELVLADAVPHHVRRFTEFSGDVSGRYIEALAVWARTKPALRAPLDALVTKLLTYQKEDGHFGDAFNTAEATDAEMAILWGNGRLLIGLAEYYKLNPRAEVLRAARRMGDFLVRVAPLFNSDAVRARYNGEKFAVGYICWTQNIEGLVALSRATREEKYLALAREMAARTDRHPAQHSHGYLTSLRGIVDLYRATGEARYLAQVEKEWQGLAASGNLMLQGGVPEMFQPQMKRDEGCSEADWLRLSLELWRETRKAEYLAAAERALFNEFAFNQFHTGDFGHHTLSPGGMNALFAHAWWCCTLHGLRAMAEVGEMVFHAKDGALEGVLEYDLPVDGRGEAAGFVVQAHSALERDGTVRLEVVSADARPHTLSVRAPEWATGLPAPVSKVWKAGEIVTLRYEMKTNLVRKTQQERRLAIFYGPWLLAVDQQASPAFFDEPHPLNRILLPADGAMSPSTAAPGPFAVPVANFMLRYLPGGYSLQPCTAMLRPIAEHTGEPDGNAVEWWLEERAQPAR